MNQVAFVSGASKGIGQAIAIAFAKNNYDVIIHYHQDEKGALKTKEMCEHFGVKTYCISFDISHHQAVAEGVKSILLAYQTIDVLINNAGIINDQLLLLMSPSDFDKVIDTNLKGTFYLTKAIAKIMAKAKSGCIINITTSVASIGNIGQANYVASKAGIVGLTKTTALELAKYHIRSNAIAPGLIQSHMSETLTVLQQQHLLDQTILKRMGSLEDVAQCALFLASKQANYITGQVFHLDGGMVLGG